MNKSGRESSKRVRKQREQPAGQQCEAELIRHDTPRSGYFRALIEVVRMTSMRTLNLHCEMNRASEGFLVNRGHFAEKRPKKLEAVIKSIEAASQAIQAGARQIEDLAVEREASEAEFERAAKALFDSAFNASFHTGRAEAFLEMALQSSRDGKRNESTTSRIAERDAKIIKRAESLPPKLSADQIGIKLTNEFQLSAAGIARIVRRARKQKVSSRSEDSGLKKTDPGTRRKSLAPNLDPT